MKEGDLVKVQFQATEMYGYGILTDINPSPYHGYQEVWMFKYPIQFGDMPPKKGLYLLECLKPIKTFEDW
jgi:hypothetical protein